MYAIIFPVSQNRLEKEKMTLISNFKSYFIKTFKIYIIIWNLFVEKL